MWPAVKLLAHRRWSESVGGLKQSGGRSPVGSMGVGSASVGCGWSVTQKNSA
jgi:hypothetical protein